MLALLFASLSGTLYVYQGQEIGMINMPKDWAIEDYKDVDAMNHYNEVAHRTSNDEAALPQAKATLQNLARDYARTPMQWTSAANAGFTGPEAVPWIRSNISAQEGVNVADETDDKSSVLAFWKQMLQTRKINFEVLIDGKFELVDEPNQTVLSFFKRATDNKSYALVWCKFSGTKVEIPEIGGFNFAEAKLVLDNIGVERTHDFLREGQLQKVLQPWEGRIYMVS